MSDTIRLHIRGAMGVQILQASAALSTINDWEEPIICVNSGGKLSYDGTNKLDGVFDIKCRVLDINDSMRKTPYWAEGVASIIFTNRNKIFRWLKPKVYDKKEILSERIAVHIRKKDKVVSSDASYDMLVGIARERGEIVIYSDDPDNIKYEPPLEVSHQSALIDWIDMYHSKEVFAAPSAFIMSMLIFDPKKHITFLGDKYCDGTYPAYKNDMIFIREAQEYCPNLKVLD